MVSVAKEDYLASSKEYTINKLKVFIFYNDTLSLKGHIHTYMKFTHLAVVRMHCSFSIEPAQNWEKESCTEFTHSCLPAVGTVWDNARE